MLIFTSNHAYDILTINAYEQMPYTGVLSS